MSGPLSIFRARAALYRRVSASPECAVYLRSNGLALPSLGAPDPIATSCGLLALAYIRREEKGRFEFAEPGGRRVFPAAIIEAFGRDRQTTVDLVAWPLDRPSDVLSMFGTCSLLGVANVYAATSYTFGQPLRVHRTPLAWLQAGGHGVVVVNAQMAARDLLDAPGRICGEDRRHSEQLASLVSRLFDRSRFVAPKAVALQDAA